MNTDIDKLERDGQAFNKEKPDRDIEDQIDVRRMRQRKIMRNRTKNLRVLYRKIRSKLGLRSGLTQKQTLEHTLDRISHYQELIHCYDELIKKQEQYIKHLRRENDQLRHQ